MNHVLSLQRWNPSSALHGLLQLWRPRWLVTGAICIFLIPFLRSPRAASAESGSPPLEIIVVQRDTKAPLPGVQVRISQGSEPLPNAMAETDRQGKAMLHWLPDKKSPVQVAVNKPGFAPLRISWANDDISTAPPIHFSFALSPSHSIGGIVQDETGQPIVGASITLSFPQRLSGPRVPIDGYVVTTDAKGHWQTEIVPVEVTLLRISTSHPDYETPDSRDAEPPSLDKLRQHALISILLRILTLPGQVLSPEGMPVAGAEVVFGGEWGIMGLESDKKTETGPDGRFLLKISKPGKVMMAAQAKGFGPALTTAEVTSNTALTILKLQKPCVLKGRVLNHTDQPLLGVRIQADDWKNFRYPGWETTTGADGRFILTNLPPDDIAFNISKGGYMRLLFHRLSPGTSEQVVKLNPSLRVHGKVTDKQTGQPIPSIKLTLGSARHEIGPNGKTRNSGAYWSSHESRTFSNGAYDLDITEPTIHGGASIPDFIIRIDAEGYEASLSRYIKPDEQEAEVNVVMEKGTGLHLTIKRFDGQPAAGAQVFTMTGYDRPQIRNGKVQYRGQANEFKPDEQGTLTLPKPLEPTRFLAMHDSGYLELEDIQSIRSPVLILQRWASLEGTLKIGPKPAANQSVALRYSPRWQETENGVRQILGLVTDYQTQTDSEGRFVFEKVPPGEVALMRVLALERPLGVSMTVGDVWGGCMMASTRLQPGAKQSITAGGEGRVVNGRLILPAEIKEPVDWNRGQNRVIPVLGKIPVPSLMPPDQLQAWLEEWLGSEVGKWHRRWLGGTPQVLPKGQVPSSYQGWPLRIEPDGSFHIDDLPAGDYSLFAMACRRMERSSGSYVPDQFLASIRHRFSVPAITNDLQVIPLDLGRLILEPITNAPPTTTGKPVTMTMSSSGNNTPLTDPASNIKVDEPAGDRLVTAGIAVFPSQIKCGGSLTLCIKVRLVPGYSIGQLGSTNATVQPTRFDVDLPPSFKLAGSWQAPETVPMPDGSRVYFREPVFRLPLIISSEAARGPVKISCQLHCQPSNSLLCWPPISIPLETSVEVIP